MDAMKRSCSRVPSSCARFTSRISQRAPTSSRPIPLRHRGSSSTSTRSAIERTRSICARPRIAREACDAFATRERPRFVAGSMGPTGMLVSSSDPSLSNITYERLRDIYAEQARALVEGGVDLLLLETMQDLLELKAAIAGIRREFARGMRQRADSGAADAHNRRAYAARNRYPRGLRRSRCTRRRGRRSELFDGSGSNARLDPLPLRERARLRQRDSECRSSTHGTGRRDDLSRRTAGARARARRLRARFRRQRRRRLLRNDARPHQRAARCRRLRRIESLAPRRRLEKKSRRRSPPWRSSSSLVR